MAPDPSIDGGPTVLIADDEPHVREIARLLLEMDGFHVVAEAADGAEALERFLALDAPDVPDVVLLDNRMPVMTGMEVAARILRHDPAQVVVMFSAFLDDAMQARAGEIGVAAWVAKTRTAQLPSLFRELLADRAQGGRGRITALARRRDL